MLLAIFAMSAVAMFHEPATQSAAGGFATRRAISQEPMKSSIPGSSGLHVLEDWTSPIWGFVNAAAAAFASSMLQREAGSAPVLCFSTQV